MKKTLSPLAATFVLLLSSAVVFPILFSMTDKLLRTLLAELNPLFLLIASFTWLLLFYFYGIKFSLEYLEREFELEEKDKLFNYSTIGFIVINIMFYLSLLSASMLSNLIWGLFYLTTIAFFYFLSSKVLRKEAS